MTRDGRPPSRLIAPLLLIAGLGAIAAARLADRVLGHPEGAFGAKQMALLVAGAALIVAAMAIAPLPDHKLIRARSAWLPWLVVGVAGVFMLWSRLGGLDQSLWHDEVYSVIHYTSVGPRTILFGDYVPNNHVLFNLLTFASTGLLGESEVVHRLWSVLPAIAAAVAIVWWAWRRLGAWTAATLALLVATSPIHHDLAREARGYGLAFLAGVLMLISACRVAEGRGRRDLAVLGSAGVLGAFTIPQFVLGFVGQLLPLLVRRQLRKRTLAMLGVVAAVVLVLYAPLLSDIARSPGTVSGGALPWHGTVSTPTKDLLQPSFDVLADRGTDAFFITPNNADQVLAGTLALIGALVLWRRGARMLSALLIVPVLFAYTVLTVGGFHVHERYGSFLLFHALVLAAIAIVGLVDALPRGVLRYAAAACVAALGAVTLVNAFTRSRHYQDLPREDFKRVAQVVEARGNSDIVTDSRRPDGLRYYLTGRDVITPPPAELEASLCSSTAPAVFIAHPYRGADEIPPAEVSCLRRRGGVRVRVRQRDRGGRIDVWFLPEARSR